MRRGYRRVPSMVIHRALHLRFQEASTTFILHGSDFRSFFRATIMDPHLPTNVMEDYTIDEKQEFYELEQKLLNNFNFIDASFNSDSGPLLTTFEHTMRHDPYDQQLRPMERDELAMEYPVLTTGNTPVTQFFGEAEEVKSHIPIVVSISTAVQKLQALHYRCLDNLNTLDQLFKEQRDLLAAPMGKEEECMRMVNREVEMERLIQHDINDLQQAHDSEMLEPSDLHQLMNTMDMLQIQQKQLQLLVNELDSLQGRNRGPSSLMYLMITRQSFPLVVSQKKEEEVHVKLLVPTNLSNFTKMGPVQASIVCDPIQEQKKPIEGDLQALDIHNNMAAKFSVKFLVGTKQAPANLRFEMDVVLSNGRREKVESNLSSPFVVVTNECQWPKCAGILLKKTIYNASQLQVPWARFANCTQYHFIKSTRQEMTTPTRPLSSTDLQWLHTKFYNGVQLISSRDFESNFWDWYGKVLKMIRYTKHIRAMWLAGHIYGFVKKEEANSLLEGHPPRTFLLRFSESHAGQFAVSYISNNREIKQYLVRPEDLKAQALPSFLEGVDKFYHLLVVERNGGGIVCKRQTKEKAFEIFQSKKKMSATEEEKDNSGYSPLEADDVDEEGLNGWKDEEEVMPRKRGR
ncbi:hypothetical protein PROFUN_12834 [Planoprotostelium fungivorum]|uniref:Signal transducer and activator of transcription n=1 Tax=Planoprotostelium fungivorum TaxID=1890364 RepID=A0A2P6N6K9_9EUKA|nr:hypothetical protein PROFUN_12834 [Planoprotostelium fungivorum]